MDPIESDWLGCKKDPIAIPENNVGNIARSWQWRERGVDPPNSASNKTVLENVAEDILVQKPLKIRCCDLPGSPRSTFLMVFSPDGTKVASTHGNHNVYVSELASGKHVRVLKGHPRTPWCIAFHPSHTQLIGSGCLGGQVRVWDIISGGSEVWYVPNQTVISSLAFHPRVQLLVVATYNELYFWDWSKPAPFTKVSTNNINEKVRYVAFDALGYKLITGISSWNNSSSPAPPVFEQTPPPRSPQLFTFRHYRRDDSDDSPSPNGQDYHNPGTTQDVIVNSYHSLVQRYDSLVRSYQRLFMFRHRMSVTPPPPATTDRGTDPMETDLISEPTSNTRTTRGESSNQSLETDPLSENASGSRSSNEDLSNQSMETDPLLETSSTTHPSHEESDQIMDTYPSPEPSSATQTALDDSSNQSIESNPFPNIMRLTRTPARQTSNRFMERDPRRASAYITRPPRGEIPGHYLEIVPSPETSDTHTAPDEISNEFSRYNRDNPTPGTTRRDNNNDNESEGNSSRLLNLDFLSLYSNLHTNHNLSQHSTFGSRPSAFTPLSESMERVFRTVDQNERTRHPPNPFSSTSGSSLPSRSPMAHQNSETSSNSSRTSIFPGLRSDTLIDLSPRRRRLIPLRLQMSFQNTQRESSTGNNESSSSNTRESRNLSENSNDGALQSSSSRPPRNSGFDLLTAPEDSQSINESLDLIRDILRDSGSRLVDLITRVSISTLVGMDREENLPNMSDDDDLDESEGTPPPRPPLSPPPPPPPPPAPARRRDLSSTSSDSDSDHSLEVNILRTPNSTFREDARNERMDESEINPTLSHEDVRSDERMTESQSNSTFTEDARNERVSQFESNSTLRQEDLRNEGRAVQPETDSTLTGEDARNVERWGQSEIGSSFRSIRNGPWGYSELPYVVNQEQSGQPETNLTTPGLGDQIERLVIGNDNADQHASENRNLDAANYSIRNPRLFTIYNPESSSSQSRRTSETQHSFNSDFNPNRPTQHASENRNLDAANYSISNPRLFTIYNPASSSSQSRRTSETQHSSNSDFNPNRPSTSRDNPWARQRGTLSEEVFRKVKAGVCALQKHTVQLTDMWLQGNAITVRELRIMWENLRRRIIMIHRENSRPESLSYYTRSLLERCRSLNQMTEVASRTIGRNTRRMEARARALREARSRNTVEVQSGTTETAPSEAAKETQSTTTEEAQSGTTEEALTRTTEEAQSVTTAEAQSKTTQEAQSGTTVEEQPRTTLETQTSTIVADQSKTTAEVRAEATLEAQSKTTMEAQSKTTMEAQSRSRAEARSRNTPTERTRSNENGNERRNQTRSPLRRSTSVRSPFRVQQPLSLSLHRWRRDEIRRRARIAASSRLSNRSRRDYERAIELAATRHEIRMRAMQVLSVMFNSMMTCLEERGLGMVIKTMLRLLKKALALSCLMIMTMRDSAPVDRDVANLHLRLDSVNVIRIQSVDHTGPVNVDDPEDLPSPPPITDPNKVDRSTQNGDVNTTSVQTTSPSTSNEQPSTSARNNTNIQEPPSPPPPSQWSNRLAVRIAEANRNTSMTARNRRDIYMESRRLKALHRTNPTAHPLIRKRIFPPITTHRIPPLRILKNSVYTKYLKARAQKSRERALQARERAERARQAELMNGNEPLVDEHPRLSPFRVPPDVADEFEQRISLIRRAHMQAVRLRNAARNRFRRLQTIRLYSPSSVREMLSLQHVNNPEDQQQSPPPALNEPEQGNSRRGSFGTVDFRSGLVTRDRFPRQPDEAQFHTVFNNVAVPLMHVNDLPTNEVERPQPQRPPTIHEYLQPIILAQNAMVVDEEGNGEGEVERGNNGGGGGGAPDGGGGDAGQRQRVANLLDAGIISGAFPAPSHRIQAWDFTTGTKNIVVAKCRIHNDASIDISKDGRILVALHPVPRLRTNNHWLGVYSLEWSRLGQCLHTAVLEQSAVSVALSPTARHLAVGVGSRRFSSVPIAPHPRNVFALLYRLEPTENSSRTGLSPVQVLEQTWEQHGFRSLNCLRWAPQPGQGFVYANNTGQLLIMN